MKKVSNQKQDVVNMEISFGQIYIQAGIKFPFSHFLQKFFGAEVSKLVEPSPKFIKLHGEDYSLIFRISAKKELAVNEIKGPTVYKKDRDVEFTIFLPYVPIMQQSDPNKNALEYLFEGVYEILGKYEIDT
jgi:hypothetical protein